MADRRQILIYGGNVMCQIYDENLSLVSNRRCVGYHEGPQGEKGLQAWEKNLQLICFNSNCYYEIMKLWPNRLKTCTIIF